MADKKRILIVEDDHVIQTLYTTIAERLGAEAVAVGNALDARARLNEGAHFDLILVDLIMPQKSGWEFLDELSRDPNMASIPVIVTTGASLSRDGMDKLLQRSCAVVQKGKFELDKFRKLIDESLHGLHDPSFQAGNCRS